MVNEMNQPVTSVSLSFHSWWGGWLGLACRGWRTTGPAGLGRYTCGLLTGQKSTELGVAVLSSVKMILLDGSGYPTRKRHSQSSSQSMQQRIPLPGEVCQTYSMIRIALEIEIGADREAHAAAATYDGIGTPFRLDLSDWINKTDINPFRFQQHRHCAIMRS